MIKKMIKKAVPSIVISRLLGLRKQVQNFCNLADGYGQWKTLRDWSSVDHGDNPIPWYTYPAIEYLTHLDLSRMRVFEYGSGNSTLWWAKRSKSVVSVESDKIWFERIKQNLHEEKIDYLLTTEQEEYISAASNDADIYIIDGKHRRGCAEHIVKLQGGCGAIMVIFDNSDWHPKTIEYLRRSLVWIQIDFHGFGPINNYTWTTTVFINPERYKEISYCVNLKSMCGLVQVANFDY